MMKRLLAAAVSGLLLTQPATARESRFSAIVADTETGHILTAEHIDSPRSAALMGRLLTVAMALEELSRGVVSLETPLPSSSRTTIPLGDALELVSTDPDGARVALASIANHVGGSVSGYASGLARVEDRVGLQGTALHVSRGDDGGPDFAGYTTPRDIARLTTSMLRAYGPDIERIFGDAPERMWLAGDGECLLVEAGPVSRHLFVAALTGAPAASSCRELATRLIRDEDERLAEKTEK